MRQYQCPFGKDSRGITDFGTSAGGRERLATLELLNHIAADHRDELDDLLDGIEFLRIERTEPQP